MCVDKELIAAKLYQILDQFNERKINHIEFHLVFPKNIHSFDGENWRTCKILLLNNFK